MNVSKLLRKWNLGGAEVLDSFHLETVRKIYKIHSEEQNFILKGIPDNVPESQICSNVKAHFFLGNEKKIAPEIFLTSEGSYYVHSDGYWFYLMEYIEGRNMHETEEDEFLLGQLAGRLHSYQEYKIKSPMSQNKERFYDWFHERNFKKEFNSILDELPDFSEYDQCLIHSDLGPHNAMVRNTGEAVLIDLDDTGIGSRFMDLGWAFIMQFVDYNHQSGEMRYRFDLAEAFLNGYYGSELISEREYDMIWKGAVYMHISYMQCYGPDAVESLWDILKFGMEQKESLWDKWYKRQREYSTQ